MPFICIDCVKNVSLKRLITAHGVEGAECDICHENRKAIDGSDNKFQQLFKALIRFHYDEWEYNTHWGGDGLEDIFHSENPILQYKETKDEDGFYSVFEAATQNVYEDYDAGVTLFAGYDENRHSLGVLRSIKSQSHPILERIAGRLKTENYFNSEPEMLDLLKKYKGVIDTTVPPDSNFFRARTGFKEKKRPFDLSWSPVYHYEPFTSGDISAPPPSIATAGRINRHGVSFFYAATDARTAISEVRPHPGDIVSVGVFKTSQSLLLADFTETRIEHFSSSDRLLDDFRIIHNINVYLNKVVPPNERIHYSVTQLIADMLRRLGYDGILFLSTVGPGHNIVVFHPELMEYKPGEGKIFEIQNLTYTMEERTTVSKESHYVEDMLRASQSEALF